MCQKAVAEDSWNLRHVANDPKFQGVCEKAVEEDPWRLYAVPDRFKTKTMCEKAVENKPGALSMSQTVLRPKRYVKGPLKK